MGSDRDFCGAAGGRLLEHCPEHFIHPDLQPEKKMEAMTGPNGPIKRGTADKDVAVSIGDKNGNVILHFGKDVSWVAFSPDQAIEVGLRMIHQSAEIMGMNVDVEIKDAPKGGRILMPMKG